MRFVAAVLYTYVCIKSLIVSDSAVRNARTEKEEQKEKKGKKRKKEKKMEIGI